ncbi:hypothetical protein SLEP1_g58956 [Rubroshorea leprosula]|uniref:non-specific serine/threonine protein kinase n=1 Tax=Rubroshorea leprosula TaxID=152421 RepID=A0AAV5MRC9_9ROSI|nr:hypothetical protein SLEP1_g58956 [Rubroshorea leprosula]
MLLPAQVKSNSLCRAGIYACSNRGSVLTLPGDSFNFRHAMDVFTLIAFVSTCFLIFLKASTANDSISPSEPLPDGKTLISNDGSFELGFFSPGTSGNRSLGIWYKNIPVCTVVWVANRVNPVNDSSGMLMVTTTGDVQLLSQNITVVWSANSTKAAQNPKLQLLDSGNLYQSGGQDLFIRMSALELGSKRNENKLKIALIIATPLAALLAMLILCHYFCKSRSSGGRIKEKKENDIKNEGPDEDMELPVFQLATISHATDNFSLRNKLGQGGFGPVFKGKLLDGQEIAVKRLSQSSGQGVNEFKNEVKLIAKLQHRNLVRLLGCCIEGEEKMLVYEYMPNRSLDSFIFDKTRGKELDWSKRFKIICGIARGLLYLHQDSRLRIIHRDLKASNVLLDEEMNPKISDFGMAKTFGGEQTEGSTRRVVGTYGYMAPEYAIDGLFSIKSDVFSLGILLLEIISGIKNRGFFQPKHSINLIGHAWKLWKEDNPLELVAESLGECFTLSEVIRCIHISFLCLQQNPEDRPPMSSVVMMLGSEIKLPQPKQPGFLLERTALEMDSPTSKHDSTSVNEITHTILEVR